MDTSQNRLELIKGDYLGKYVAVESFNCCVCYLQKQCVELMIPQRTPCAGIYRKDGRDIVWILDNRAEETTT
jgi:hypothetical protein